MTASTLQRRLALALVLPLWGTPLACQRPPEPCTPSAPEPETPAPRPTATPSAPPAAETPSCGLPLRLQRPEWPKELTSTLEEELEPPPPGTTTLAILPDTQYYAACRYPHLQNQATWLANERVPRRVVGAVSLGDLTDHDTAEEWTFVRDSLAPVPPELPLMLTTGNHDTGVDGDARTRTSQLSSFFPPAWAQGSGALQVSFAPAQLENSFYSIDAGSFRLGVLMLEWSPRTTVLAWANAIVQKHRDHRFVIVTHAYLYDDGTRYDWASRGNTQLWNPITYGTQESESATDAGSDGEMLWNGLVRRHANIFLVLSGHVLRQGSAHLTSRGDAGNTVHQVLANYQMLDEGGLGYLRLAEFLPDGRTVHLKTYSPSLRLFSYASEQDFRLQVEPPLFAAPRLSVVEPNGTVGY